MWGATAVEEWPLNALGFAAALAFVCDGSDDMLATVRDMSLPPMKNCNIINSGTRCNTRRKRSHGVHYPLLLRRPQGLPHNTVGSHRERILPRSGSETAPLIR